MNLRNDFALDSQRPCQLQTVDIMTTTEKSESHRKSLYESLFIFQGKMPKVYTNRSLLNIRIRRNQSCLMKPWRIGSLRSLTSPSILILILNFWLLLTIQHQSLRKRRRSVPMRNGSFRRPAPDILRRAFGCELDERGDDDGEDEDDGVAD